MTQSTIHSSGVEVPPRPIESRSLCFLMIRIPASRVCWISQKRSNIQFSVSAHGMSSSSVQPIWRGKGIAGMGRSLNAS